MAIGKIRIVLVDDHAIVRAALRLVLTHEPDMDVVGEASNGASALAIIRNERPDVAIVDLMMPGMSGTELIERLHREHPLTHAIALTVAHGFTHARDVLAAGAVGYVVKDAEAPVLLSAIRAAHRGRTFVELGASEGGADDFFQRSEDRARLSPRELEVLRMLAYGHVGREIAERLHLSVKTIETYRHRLGDKLGLHTRADLVQFALDHGLLDRRGEARSA